jgi:acetyl esterase/lipase
LRLAGVALDRSTLIQVGSAETLLDDAVRFAAEAGTRSVFVMLEIWPNMIHAWHLWTRIWKKDAGRSVMQADFCGATLGAAANSTAPPPADCGPAHPGRGVAVRGS